MTVLRVGAQLIDEVEPAGLDYCRRHGLSTSYKTENWLIYPNVNQEVLIADDTVIWTRGSVLIRAFSFPHEEGAVKLALLASFESDEDQQTSSEHLVPQLGSRSRISLVNLQGALKSTAHLTHSQKRVSSREDALVVLVGDLLLIYYADGRRDVVSIPFAVRKLYAATQE